MTSPDEPTQPQPDEPRGDEPGEPRGEEPGYGPERPQAAAPPRPRLTRSSTDRIIGGVAGGLGRHLGIDPILVRIAFVLLCFAGGAGFLAYLALLAFVPSDDGQPGVGQTSRTTTVAATVALAVAAVIFLGPPAVVFGPGLLVLALLAVVAVLIYRAAGGGGDDPGRTAARAGLALLAALAAIGGAIGVAFVAALGGGVVIGILAVVTGLALVATAFLGGARWLIVPALVLALPLAVVAAGDIDIRGGVGDRVYHPRSTGELRAGYRLGMGQLDLDLRDANLPAGRTDLKVDLGIGQARIRVADNVCVTTNADVGAGVATIFGSDNGGVDVAYADTGATPDPSRPQLHIDASVGAGRLDVDRGGFAHGWWDHTAPAAPAAPGVACP